MSLLASGGVKIRVSSVLNRNVRQFGKQHLTDNDEETCWNSDQGSPQVIMVEFPNEVLISELVLKFQGGFVGKDCLLLGQQQTTNDDTIEWKEIMEFFPKDISSEQIFNCKESGNQLEPVKKLKIVFQSSFDFFGRVTIYKLDIIGSYVVVDR
ncbi:hypothetical protein HELRODRAFT_188174 [Helobdella robusta]|uniref:Nuclear receptor 2C2-associated protein n=1 Tax=Helobdella robusta TaxID=6412 RepID=T1FPQ6_HELRO|nr:hypothetical protein HELRODRAFT_188174 [Helobdella robusta]ESO13231.1 hypothetical protein HELRODRAFT_188174 [Helobdella robusta]